MTGQSQPWENLVTIAAPTPAPVANAEARSVQGEQLWWPPWSGGSAGIPVTERTALELPAMLAALTVLATDTAVLPLNVYQRQPDGGRIHRYDHPVEERLAVNPDGEGESTAVTWRSAWMGHALQYGNGYAEIQRTGRGATYGLHLLDPEQTRATRVEGKLRYRTSDGKYLLPANVLHLAGLGYDGITGYSYIRLLRRAIGVGIAEETYTADYFSNGSEPGGVIESPIAMKPEAIRNLRQGWEGRHGGPGQRHKVAVLEQGAKWNATATDPEKAQLIESRKYQLLDVIRAWRVPPHKAGDYSMSHLANIEASNLDYLMTALMYWLVAIEQQCCLKLFTPAERRAGLYVEHNVNALLRGDIVSRFNAYHQSLSDGWMNRDEVRQRENMGPIGEAIGGDKYLVQLNQTTLELIGEAEAAESPGQQEEEAEIAEEEETSEEDEPAAKSAVRNRPRWPVSRRYNEFHDEKGQFAEGDSGDGGGGGGEGALDQATTGHDDAALKDHPEVKEWHKDAAEQIADRKENDRDEKAQLEKEQKSEVKDLEREHVKEVKSLEREQAKAIKELDKDQKKEAKGLVREQEKDSAELEKEQQQERDELAKDPTATTQDHADQADDHRGQKEGQQETHQADRVNMADEHQQARESTAADHAEAMKELKEGHQKERDGQADTHKEQLADLAREQAQGWKDFKDDLKADYGALIADLKQRERRRENIVIGVENVKRAGERITEYHLQWGHANHDVETIVMTTERRTQSAPELRIERRSEGTGQAAFLTGYASVFNEWTTLIETSTWVWREIVRPGAFSAALAERQDVRMLLNHDPNFVIGRTASGTLTLSERDKGLLQETRLSDAQMVRDMIVTPIERQDISGMSFSFQVRNGNSGQTVIDRGDGTFITKRGGERIVEYQKGDVRYTDRELLALDLFDVTVATFPAYSATTVGLRAGGDIDFARAEQEARQRFQDIESSRRSQSRQVASRRVRLRLAESEVGSH
jgi:HK97 family phage portal protein/HK97 family phage prohead protease